MLAQVWGEAVPARELTKGFDFEGQRINLVAWSRGIFKPEQLGDGPLTVLSSLASGYEDEHLEGDVMLYDYAPPAYEWANTGIKRLAELGRPLIMLKQVKGKPGTEYMVIAPVAILGFDDAARTFRLSLADSVADAEGISTPQPSVFSKQYAETITMARLHQAHFRREVLGAYGGRCCVCELRERPLLDAAHILADRLPEGVPTVKNGLSMCAVHHRAYDTGLLLVTEEYRVEIPREKLAFPEDSAARILTDHHGRAIRLPGRASERPEPGFLRRKNEMAA